MPSSSKLSTHLTPKNFYPGVPCIAVIDDVRLDAHGIALVSTSIRCWSSLVSFLARHERRQPGLQCLEVGVAGAELLEFAAHPRGGTPASLAPALLLARCSGVSCACLGRARPR